MQGVHLKKLYKNKGLFSILASSFLIGIAGLFPDAHGHAQPTLPAEHLDALPGLPGSDPQHSFMRFPTLHGDKIVFVAHGNLWAVSRAGGQAYRLTSESGQEYMPRFSPDGKWIAFTGNYEGNQDVYVIPAQGGIPRRLTYHSDIVPHAPERWGVNNMVVTWTPDSENIIFLSRRKAWNSWITLPFQVSVKGGLPTQLPLDRGGLMSFSPDGKKIVYNRIFRNFRTWKHYRGGLAQKLYTYDFTSRMLTPLADWKGTSTDPMWNGQKIYFVSDRPDLKRRNIWSYDLTNGKTTQITHFTDYDVDFASLGDQGIVFQKGGHLYLIDLPTEQLHTVEVTIADDASRTAIRYVKASKYVRPQDPGQQVDYDLSPNGARLAISARGDILTVPAEYGAPRNLTRSSDADEDHPVWSPDGKWVAYTTDVNGEQQIAYRPAEGGPEKLVTHFHKGYLYRPVFSPSGRSVAFSDGAHQLWIATLNGATPVKVAVDQYNEIHDQSWSPDGRWLAYSLTRDNGQKGLWLYDLENKKNIEISSPAENDSQPVFSPDGKYLYFISARHENSIFSEHEFNVATAHTTGLYSIALRANEPSPFPIRSDEGAAVSSPKKEEDQKADISSGNLPATLIDIEGLANRAIPVPLAAGTISAFQLRGHKIFYLLSAEQTIDGPLEGEDKGQLRVYDIKERKDAEIQGGVEHFSLAADGKKLVYYAKKTFTLIDAKEKHDPGKPFKLDTVKIKVNPPQEWANMFRAAWRLERDLFVNPLMNGVDWNEIYDRYGKLLPLVGSRSDLNYLIGEIQGELGNSHTYVGGGDENDTHEVIAVPLLGADFTLDKASGRYVFSTIYAGDNTRKAYRSPLTQPGNIVNKRDYLLAINGHDLRAPQTPFQLLSGEQGPITLTVSSLIAGKPHTVIVEPVKSELPLREKEWIDHNRETVDRLSQGEIGYIYLSDMEALGMEQFTRQFYAQLEKKAVIIDDRWNGGGFIDQIVLERLRRTLVGMTTNREGMAQTIPQQVINGPKVTLINQFSASDGDIFPYYFRAYGLGKVIGMRSWGGVRGIRGPWPLLDGGYITIPEESQYGANSQWIMENYGVQPDIEVENSPADLLDGHDKQLETAIKYLMEKLNHRMDPVRPSPPSWQPAYPPAALK